MDSQCQIRELVLSAVLNGQLPEHRQTVLLQRVVDDRRQLRMNLYRMEFFLHSHHIPASKLPAAVRVQRTAGHEDIISHTRCSVKSRRLLLILPGSRRPRFWFDAGILGEEKRKKVCAGKVSVLRRRLIRNGLLSSEFFSASRAAFPFAFKFPPQDAQRFFLDT